MRLFGKRGDAFFDAWTIVHLAFWFVIGANMEQLHFPHWLRWTGVIAVAYLWEVFESWLDSTSTIEMTRESWLNRWVSDPLMAVVGSMAGMLVIGT